ncbi:MAG: hypothetical protein PHV55_04005 [Candidatus Omnitrophica bacterium]|nr:hypothetical protein [Candidatus Omnitrophota bacterium]
MAGWDFSLPQPTSQVVVSLPIAKATLTSQVVVSLPIAKATLTSQVVVSLPIAKATLTSQVVVSLLVQKDNTRAIPLSARCITQSGAVV